MTSFFRKFELLLRPHTKPFHPRSNVHYSNDIKKPVNVYQFHEGHVIGAGSSHVIAHLTDDGILTAIIMMDHDVYYIEVRDLIVIWINMKSVYVVL